jgi:hypothetical protein
MIRPTPGRIVWYTPAANERIAKGADPLAAIVVLVHNDRLVNLTVFDGIGGCNSRQAVQLVQDGDPALPETEAFASWMPYQLGQAKKDTATPAA